MSSANISDGVYFIRSRHGVMVHLEGEGKVVGHAQDFTQLDRQLWRVESVPGQSSFIITNIHTGKVLDLWGGGKDNGTRIVGCGRHGRKNQQWNIRRGERYAFDIP